ncbi:helix-turn-helix transcriptional regulator [Bacillaceae bacterium S4-13-58]
MTDPTLKKMTDQFLMIRMKNQQNEYLHPSYLLEKKLIQSITLGDREGAIKILSSINKDQRPSLAHNTTRSLKNSLVCSCTLFTRAIIEGGVEPETAFNLSDAYILEIERLEDARELSNLEYIMLTHFIQTLHDEEKLPYPTIVNHAITFINQHILQKLSLPMIASNCYVSPSYLSHLFKKEVGLSVVQFINKRRVEESRNFLLHTTSSISEIATLFQFCNQSYYTAQFKEYMGITPKEFRQYHLE